MDKLPVGDFVFSEQEKIIAIEDTVQSIIDNHCDGNDILDDLDYILYLCGSNKTSEDFL
jgi:hypothetical protein